MPTLMPRALGNNIAPNHDKDPKKQETFIKLSKTLHCRGYTSIDTQAHES